MSDSPDHEYRLAALESIRAAERLAVAEREIEHIETAIRESGAKTDNAMREYQEQTENHLREIQEDFKTAMEAQSSRAHRTTVTLLMILVPILTTLVTWGKDFFVHLTLQQ